jgi:hypothetical protein
MNDVPLMAAYEELRSLLANPCVPEDVARACLRLSECQTKLFCTVPEGYRTGDWANRIENAGASDFKGWGLRLEPSNLLRELLAALRAFEWPRVMILVHGATSGSEPEPTPAEDDCPKFHNRLS